MATDDLPDDVVIRAETLSFGFLTLLETLTPGERAAFVLRDILGWTHVDVADALDLAPASARQAVSRARRRLASSRTAAHVDPVPVTGADRDRADQLAAALVTATASGDTDQLIGLLSPQVRLIADGGGVVKAGVRCVVGSDRVARLLINVANRITSADRVGGGIDIVFAAVNGWPGAMIFDGTRWLAITAETVDGLVERIPGAQSGQVGAHRGPHRPHRSSPWPVERCRPAVADQLIGCGPSRPRHGTRQRPSGSDEYYSPGSGAGRVAPVSERRSRSATVQKPGWGLAVKPPFA
ncbi:MAG: sigma factor-like helix-turn-helix DNA-binding protein [Acidimicrobiales bacterium]